MEPLARGEFPGKMGEVALWRCEGRRGRTAGTKDGCVREPVRRAAELTADGRKVVPVRRACRHPSPGQRTRGLASGLLVAVRPAQLNGFILRERSQ